MPPLARSLKKQDEYDAMKLGVEHFAVFMLYFVEGNGGPVGRKNCVDPYVSR